MAKSRSTVGNLDGSSTGVGGTDSVRIQPGTGNFLPARTTPVGDGVTRARPVTVPDGLMGPPGPTGPQGPEGPAGPAAEGSANYAIPFWTTGEQSSGSTIALYHIFAETVTFDLQTTALADNVYASTPNGDPINLVQVQYHRPTGSEDSNIILTIYYDPEGINLDSNNTIEVFEPGDLLFILIVVEEENGVELLSASTIKGTRG